MSLMEAAASQNRLKALCALRDVLAERIEGSESARDVAALSGQLVTVLKQIDDLDGSGKKAGAVDEIAERRRSRRKPIRDGRHREASP